jgi:hypothetical protein
VAMPSEISKSPAVRINGIVLITSEGDERGEVTDAVRGFLRRERGKSSR